jgi:hypothetical protein
VRSDSETCAAMFGRGLGGSSVLCFASQCDGSTVASGQWSMVCTAALSVVDANSLLRLCRRRRARAESCALLPLLTAATFSLTGLTYRTPTFAACLVYVC